MDEVPRMVDVPAQALETRHAAPFTDSASPPSEARVGEIERGESLGRYVVLGLLGKGGMGMVYAAYDPELDRKVALKLLISGDSPLPVDTGSDTSCQRVRLIREAQALAKLSHPNVISVYDTGTVDGRVFMAMEYVEGVTLREWGAETHRNWREVLAMYDKAGEGLAAAHAAGLTHRDFKPGNVMVGESGGVYVLDFGLVHDRPAAPTQPWPPACDGDLTIPDPPTLPDGGLGPANAAMENTADVTVAHPGANAGPPPSVTGLSGRSGHSSELTEFGSAMGTPAYMPPEQYEGTATHARSDQFSFCVALYESLYGERPFKGPSFDDLHRATLRGVIADPEDTCGVPNWVRSIVLKGLATDPTQRHANMPELLERLRRDPVQRRRQVAATLLGLGVLVTGVWAYLASQAAPPTVCGRGKDQVAQVWNQGAEQEGRVAFIATGLAYAASAHAGASEILAQYADDWSVMHRQTCEATRVWGEQSEALLDRRMSCLRRRIDALRGLVSVFRQADPGTVTRATNTAMSLPDLSGCEDTEALLARIALPEAAEARERVTQLQARHAELTQLVNSVQLDDARPKVHELIQDAEEVRYRPILAEAHGLLAILESMAGDTKLAIPASRTAMYIAEAVGSYEVAAHASLNLMWNDVYMSRNFDKAADYQSHSEALLERAGEPPLLVARMYRVQAAVLEPQGRSDEREVFARKELEIYREHLRPGDPRTTRALVMLAYSVASPLRQDTEEAAALIRESLEIGRARASGGVSEILCMGERAEKVRKPCPDEHRQ
ncbi:MAG: serine/threonine-protein kinase [Nannocystaceae bacterium]